MNSYFQCPKCEKYSGDDWFQCGKYCPIPNSPHFKPIRELSKEEYINEIRYQSPSYYEEEIPF